MLRVTVHDDPGALTFQPGGRLAGPWVRVPEECWQSTVAGRREMFLRLDLTEVTAIDAAGRGGRDHPVALGRRAGSGVFG